MFHVESILAWLESHRNIAPLFVGIAAFLEYVFPPFPGDLIVVFAAFAVIQLGWSMPWVIVAILLGSLGGSMCVYAAGRFLQRHLRGQPPMWRWLDRVLVLARKLQNHPALWLIANRFIPSVRALFFLAAGLAEIPAILVAIYGFVSALLWSCFLLLLGLAIGSSWPKLSHFFLRYTQVVLGVFIVAILIWLIRSLTRRKDREPKL